MTDARRGGTAAQHQFKALPLLSQTAKRGALRTATTGVAYYPMSSERLGFDDRRQPRR